MEKIEWLIDKLKRQYDTAAGNTAMLTTLQLLQQELANEITEKPPTQRIAVIMPAPQWNANADSILDAYEAENLHSDDEQKVVFELDPYVEEEEDQEALEQEDTKPEVQPVTEPIIAKPETEPREIYASYMPEAKPVFVSEPSIKAPETETPPASFHAVVMPNPVPETDKKSLNELHEKPLPEVYNRFHEPIKDLKKAISINDRYLFINNLFSGDEAAFDRSIKTINNFNIFSEAEYWIRREVSVKYGWEESDRLVQQFYGLVSRRFS